MNSQVAIEQELQPGLATLHQDGDIAMNGFWDGRSERCFVDICPLRPCFFYTESMKMPRDVLMLNVFVK